VTCGANNTGIGGGFASPNYPGNYYPSLACEWFVENLRGNRIFVTFFGIQTQDLKDFVTVRDGFDADSPVLNQYSGTLAEFNVTTSGSKLRITFTSDDAVEDIGFSLTWKAID